jgi:hypothetical protein
MDSLLTGALQFTVCSQSRKKKKGTDLFSTFFPENKSENKSAPFFLENNSVPFFPFFVNTVHHERNMQ